jgi:hypothetical protein
MESKTKLLVKGLLFDAIGMFSYSIPLFSEYTDILWAPLSAFILYRMYPGIEGKIGSLVNFAEEFLPFIDVIPTFTLTWIYKFVISKK